MSQPVEYLDLDDLISLAADVLGDPPPIRDVGLLGSATAAGHGDVDQVASALRQLASA